MGTILVGVDGSSNAVHALEWAVVEAGRRNDELLVMYCLHMPLATAPVAEAIAYPQIESMREYASEVLDAVASTANGMAPDLAVGTELVVRPPSAGLLEAAQDASLLVVGARGLGALGAMFLGSVSTRVAGHAPCPTVVVPAAVDASAASGPVVVGVDGSDHGDAALRFALDAAARRDLDLIAVYGRGRVDELDLPDEVERSEQAQAEDVLAQAIQRTGAEGTEVTVTPKVVRDDPADAVLESGDGAALTVVGSRGRGGFRSMLLGSVSQTVLHDARSPIAVVRAL